MVQPIIEFLSPCPGLTGVDATLGYGGHAQEILPLLQPEGRLIGLDADPVQLPTTENRLRDLGFATGILVVRRTNFAGLPKILAEFGVEGVDFVLADLGLSSMQIDNPARGFSFRQSGPLDMRMNPQRGLSAAQWLERTTADSLAQALQENADEPRAEELALRLAGQPFATTQDLSLAVRRLVGEEEWERTVRRVFQALRIAVNDEFSALETFLRNLPGCLKPGGRAAILTFHSGEDRRVKKWFAAGLARGDYSDVPEFLRPSAEEQRANTRATSAKLRMAVR